ncbi:hypothetical protein DelCs14_3369 [Delftia sp. Cs1-4]|nr:hypothetical protein DelCs14_3369 [Delftia sp. Cs1-4]SOE36501.1 hypothetical protein SAMN05216519_2517 [Delftia acidovorans]
MKLRKNLIQPSTSKVFRYLMLIAIPYQEMITPTLLIHRTK